MCSVCTCFTLGCQAWNLRRLLSVVFGRCSMERIHKLLLALRSLSGHNGEASHHGLAANSAAKFKHAAPLEDFATGLVIKKRANPCKMPGHQGSATVKGKRKRSGYRRQTSWGRGGEYIALSSWRISRRIKLVEQE